MTPHNAPCFHCLRLCSWWITDLMAVWGHTPQTLPSSLVWLKIFQSWSSFRSCGEAVFIHFLFLFKDAQEIQKWFLSTHSSWAKLTESSDLLVGQLLLSASPLGLSTHYERLSNSWIVGSLVWWSFQFQQPFLFHVVTTCWEAEELKQSHRWDMKMLMNPTKAKPFGTSISL